MVSTNDNCPTTESGPAPASLGVQHNAAPARGEPALDPPPGAGGDGGSISGPTALDVCSLILDIVGYIVECF